MTNLRTRARAASGSSSLRPPLPMQPLRLGLVGFQFGRWLLRSLQNLPGVEVVAIADRRATAAELAAFGVPVSVRLHADAVAMLDTEALDALVIATSPKRRAPLLAAAAARKLPLFVEKPWAGNPAQARAFAAACAPIADRVMLGFSFRFHGAVQKLRTLLDTDLGPAWSANGEYSFHWNLPPTGWLWEPDAGGGVFNENSCHLLDVVCHLLGRPVAVQAATHNPRGYPAPEFAAVSLTFADGGIAALSFGALGAAAFTDYPRLDLITAHGRASLRGRNHIWESLAWARHDDRALSTFEAPPETGGATRYTAAFTHFADCVRTGAAPRTTIADGLLAVDLAAALTESAATGRRVSIEALPTSAGSLSTSLP